MKLYICSLLILAVFNGLNCAPSPQEQYGTRGHEVLVSLNPKLKLGLALGQRSEDGLLVIQPEINPSFDGSAGYYRSFLPPPGYNGYPQYSNYPQIPYYPQSQPPQQYPINQQSPNVPQNQLPQQHPINQQSPNVPQNQLPQQHPINQQSPNVPQNLLTQQYSNNQPNTFVPQNQAPIQLINHQDPEMPNYQPYQYPNNSQITNGTQFQPNRQQ